MNTGIQSVCRRRQKPRRITAKQERLGEAFGITQGTAAKPMTLLQRPVFVLSQNNCHIVFGLSFLIGNDASLDLLSIYCE